MPEKETIERAREDAREGKSPSTQAGEFVREEMHHVREGKHGAASAKQAIAIGLSKARRSSVVAGAAPREGIRANHPASQPRLPRGKSHSRRQPSAPRSRAISGALKKEGHSAASHRSLSRQARTAAKRRSSAARHNSAVLAQVVMRVHLLGEARVSSSRDVGLRLTAYGNVTRMSRQLLDARPNLFELIRA